ncbi:MULTISPECIES: amino acid ABC transporter permease [Clostridium]|uniref:Amino acid ABC transporter membrane protein, PAAT family n=1 Tax=Clostridium cadaveris TaxID=1529 RepID=A0A1I2KJ66_9CLOT|nr:amino acid ABC transporter permease [Clostridium cadaveris]MDU4952141.1 amino acid ABC transporter permease [Clostridium sp.]MDM8313488.1 amino acid ABC transporter permease [Clostridium cadaveris]MDY4950375.1 amino acid ABC transporter permease [Clostridium cadaveris]NME65093.1 amino acid ABC transporter permease [Clostridium cadaveris]NWK12295.1 amino acid ABC transporter permease [Clostridium cadaveris]
MQMIVELMPQFLSGLLMTLKVFIFTIILAMPLGVITAIGRLSKIKIISRVTEIYIWIMRGTPLLLQVVFIYFGLPVIGIKFDRFAAIIIAFVLNYGAYFGEIFRGGISSIDQGQYEGGEVLGMTPSNIFFRIIFPQAVKRIIPAVSNEIITLVKDTSLVYIVGLDELLRVAKIASNREASLIPLLLAGVVYLIIVGALTKMLRNVEGKYNYYS